MYVTVTPDDIVRKMLTSSRAQHTQISDLLPRDHVQQCRLTKCRVGVPGGEQVCHMAADSLRVVGEVKRLERAETFDTAIITPTDYANTSIYPTTGAQAIPKVVRSTLMAQVFKTQFPRSPAYTGFLPKLQHGN